MVRKLSLTIYCLLLLMSCKPQPQPINYGKDVCSFCLMTIVDPRYAAELVTDKAKVYKFDAVECMVNFMNDQRETLFTHTLVSTFDGKTLREASSCYYIRSEALPSPMGMYITSISERDEAVRITQEHVGKIYSWDELSDNFHNLPSIQPAVETK